MTGPGRLPTALASVVVLASLAVYVLIPIFAPNSDRPAR